MAPKTVPPGLPLEIPNYPLPIELPIINPTPGESPTPQPLRIPQGNPVPVPNTDPQQYKQPFLRVTPAPTPSSPWQVDVQPEDVVSNSPSPVLEPETPAEGTPSGTTEKEDFCAAHPNVLSCADLDQPEDQQLETKDVGGNVTPDGGWGATSAACPAPRHLTVQGRDIPIPFDLFCQYMAGIRPVVIAMAWLTAAFILLGFRTDD